MKKYRIRKVGGFWGLWTIDPDRGTYMRITSWLGSQEACIRMMDYRESLHRAG